MNRSKAIITIGILVALLPILGFPRSWESYFQVAAGLSLVALSVWSTIDKKISQRAKAHKRQTERMQVEAVVRGEEEAVEEEKEEEKKPGRFGRRITDLYPKTGQRGRRAADINWNTIDRPLP
jgi:hypothetical protein